MVLVSTSLITGCKPRNEPVNENLTSTQQENNVQVPLIQSKTVTMKITKPEACDAEGCTQYDLQTVETNVDWINSYFNARIKKAEPIAFSTEPNEKVQLGDGSVAGLSQSSIAVRYISQWYNVATFAIDSYTYSAGAAHGLYHTEYVNFDLSQKKRIALQDILVKGAEQKVLYQLYDANSIWLSDHNIERQKLQLSDNFYYGPKGIVFVYPLYELASYAEGMSELTLPYQMSQSLFKPQYLPSLPNYKKL
ncbi:MULTISPECIES: RsiV family protein [unclassified Acinetobacter]|uniref:RsiV family protein n=1 Tax=unclassified Acinetobacter TaxID=196816 RepID=UPI00293479FB|nr:MULTISPECIES: RsiV family protein [unclassified Acinetobacter]WOE33192.1 RsiV family protein [Acinetobacter sp. SAAs470]WOE39853.1 RsiV family protein [Acinetobacter sp. SAAs474]